MVRDLRIVVCNDALRKILGYSHEDELLGKNVRILFPDEDAWEQAVHNGMSSHQGSAPPSTATGQRPSPRT